LIYQEESRIDLEVDSEIPLSNKIINQKETGIGIYCRRDHVKDWFRIYLVVDSN